MTWLSEPLQPLQRSSQGVLAPTYFHVPAWSFRASHYQADTLRTELTAIGPAGMGRDGTLVTLTLTGWCSSWIGLHQVGYWRVAAAGCLPTSRAQTDGDRRSAPGVGS